MSKDRLFEIVEKLNNADNFYSSQIEDVSESIYCIETWEEQDLHKTGINTEQQEGALVFCHKDFTKERVFKSLGENIIQIHPGNEFRQINPYELELNLLDESSYMKLYDWLTSNHIEIRLAINCFCLCENEILDEKVSTFSVDFFFHMSKHVLRGKGWDILFFYMKKNPVWNATCAATSAFFRVLSNENSRICCHSIELSSINELCLELINDERTSKNLEVKYVSEKRYIKKLELTELIDDNAKFTVREGNYVIIGGLGGLGTLLASHLITEYNAKVIVCSRNCNYDLIEEAKAEIRKKGGDTERLVFHSCDITSEESTKKFISQIAEQGKINGIIHCAATSKDSMIIKKEKQDFDYVINPKVNSIKQVELIAKECRSDYILYFSSIAPYVGTVGQCDYAYGNSFLNNYVSEQKNLNVRLISIAWPLWESRGMNASKLVKNNMQKQGFDVLSREQGIKVFETVLNSGKSGTIITFYGKKREIIDLLGLKQEGNERGSSFMNKEKINLFLKESIASITKHQVTDIDDYEYFENLGIDSIKMINIIAKMEEKLGSLPKTLFFEYERLDQLEEFVEKEYAQLFNTKETATKPEIKVQAVNSAAKEQEVMVLKSNSQTKFDYDNEPIAIIGFDGKFPGADNVEEYWKVLSEGMDCIIEVPKERWDYNNFYSQQDNRPGMTNCKWGGFLNKPEYFDAEFFNYSPIEATMIDPQERIFLETVWNTMENAGYTRNKLKEETVGVYVGIAWGHYQFYETKVEDYTLSPVSSFSSIANRVSYFLDLKGPSMAVDTMCSSSGTAIHLACESIRSGESTLAFAGGVNLSVHPAKYKVLSTKNYLSSEGRCRSFGEGGDGYVPGEGVGALLLKPLSKAISDGDHVEAVILATGVNHGGKATGYSVPSPNAQGELIRKTIEKANIKPTDITYIEAHGTGTSLGDPIEIVGLSKGLNIKGNYSDKYLLGSVKSNIGHLESAAAVSGLIKVILQMKHNTIVPSLYSDNLNKKIDFDTLPFEVVQQLQPWELKEEHKNGKIEFFSAVSSFGAGGSNSFTILGKLAQETDKRAFVINEQLIVISALSEKALRENICSLKEYVQQQENTSSGTFVDICYTLQTGREAMPYRAAFLANSIDELSNELNCYIEGKTSEKCYSGFVEKNVAKGNLCMETATELHVKNHDMKKLAQEWVSGKYVDWEKLYTKEVFKPKKIALPTYSFQKERFWILDYGNEAGTKINVDLIHPMIDVNNSTINRQIYKKRLLGHEPYLSNHVVNGKVLMPGAGFVELSRAAGQLALAGIGTVKNMSNVVFRRPLVVEQPSDIVVECYPKKGGLLFEIKDEKEKNIVYCAGEVSYLGAQGDYIEEESSLKDEVYASCIDTNEIYSMLKRAGFSYGEYYQCIKKISLVEDTVIAKLEIEEDIANENSFYELKPSLVDSALQSASILLKSEEDGNKFIPSKIENIIIYGSMTNTCTAVVKTVSCSKSGYVFNIKIYDAQGNICVQICNYTIETYSKPENINKAAVRRIENSNEIDRELKSKVAEFVKHSISKEIGVDTNTLKESDDFEKYGIDSVITMRITDRLNQVFKTLPATLLFEHKLIGSLIDFLFSDFHDIAVEHFGEDSNQLNTQNEEAEKTDYLEADQKDADTLYNSKYSHSNEDIAIIGIAGRYPQSDNLDIFWDNLVHGKDCIEEVPLERWDYRPLYSADKNEKGKISSKWGGFINGAEEFDADFFGIVPIQAAIMDPQERIYLQSAWNCIEDAGYTVKALENYKVGVYTGEMWGCYQKVGVEETLKGNVMSLSSSFASTSNKVSYIMNLHGPSMTVDTMCSSSLTAIHLACKAINDGSIDMAIAGGVNLSLHPDKYISLSQGKFLSTNGRCKSFGEGGDGYVPGEGVGTILLKKVSQAEKDKDHIYAVIKATSINHGGRSNAYFVPNVIEQKNLIVEALKNADISPRTISTVEAHGTGTALGDPIEVEGFNKAYRLYTQDKQYCAIGSVKSNIGHLESAAGIAALTKVLLEMQHKKLVPSIHSEILNSKIDFAGSPFYVQHEYEEWKKPIINENGQLVEYPRRAAISAFGAGGTNVHIVLEENKQKEDLRNIQAADRIFVFSAKNKERLEELLQKFVQFLKQQEFFGQAEENSFMYDLESNLLMGRQFFKCRIAIVAKKIDEILSRIEAYLADEEQRNLFIGEMDANSIVDDFFEDEDGKQYLITLMKKKNLQKIAKLWVNNVDFDYNTFVGEQYRKISMPTYCFEKRVIKPPKVKNEIQERRVALHSMVDNNVSKIQNQQFVKQFTGNEFYLKDHVIKGRSILPAAAFLEMLRASGTFSVHQGVVSQITKIVWLRPLMLDGSNAADAYINLIPQGESVKCEIETINQLGVHLLHCTANLELVKYDPKWRADDKLDLNYYKEICTVNVDGGDFYKEFEKTDFVYGKRLQFIDRILVSEASKCAMTVLHDTNQLFEKENYTLHPAILDSGIQSVAALINSYNRSYLPHSVEKVEILDSLDNVKYVLIHDMSVQSDTISFDLEFVSEDGKVLLKFVGLTVKEQKVAEKEDVIQYFTTIVEETAKLPMNNEKPKFIILDNTHELYDSVKQLGLDAVLVRPGNVKNKISQTEYEICSCEEQDYKWLFQNAVNNSSSTCIIYNLNRDLSMDFDINYAEEFFVFVKAVVSSGLRSNIKLFHVFSGDIQSANKLSVNPMYLACAGLLKTAVMEMPKLVCKNIAFDKSIARDSIKLAGYLRDELALGTENVEEIYYSFEDKRHIRALKELTGTNPQQSTLKVNGVYYIIGGLKGIGLKFAEYLATTYKANLIISGRTELSAENKKHIENLQRVCESVLYLQADVNVYQDMKNSIELIRNTYGRLDGIVYSAGIKQDELIINKTPETFTRIIETKTLGIQNTCKAVGEEPVDFIITFSSLAGLMGNMGQADYAYANNYLDAYATVEGFNGKNMLSINWPYWLDGGMRLKDSEIEGMKKRNNMVPLQTKDGLQAFEFAISNLSSVHQLFVLASDNVTKSQEVKTVKEDLSKSKEPSVKKSVETKGVSASESAISYLKNVISEETQIEANRIKNNEAFDAYGLDSVMIMNITVSMEKEFGELPKTLLYENHNINELNEYLQTNYTAEYNKLFGSSSVIQAEYMELEAAEEYEDESTLEYTTEREKIIFSNYIKEVISDANTVCNEDIAVIGLITKAPEADNIDEYWQNILQNKNCITEVSEERWDYKPYFSEVKGEIGKTYCKYGGFMKDIDKFDPLFFNIAPSNAAFIEPQERILLQETWHLFENAGYAVSNLKNRDVGVFVGAMWQQYQMLLMNGPAQGMIPSLFSNLANRLSSYYDLSGPSIALDTMCSGSLTALHLAINSIRNGECSSAVVAGVNTSIHPSKYINLSQGGLLSTDSKCKPFGKGADGYIPAEGLGLMLIKPLSQAIKDKDNIHIVIKSNEMAHSGKGGGFMVPNPKAQAQVIEKAIRKAKVPIQSINYIEAQGTCTEIGDAVEVKGMSAAFSNFTKEKQVCSVGSAKYHIGHTEAASGILAIAKITMQMKNHLIPGILNDDEINEKLPIADSPFYIQQQASVWEPYSQNGEKYPLTAGLNGFGGGGSYVHFILQEYVEPEREVKKIRKGHNAFILSGKNKNALKQMIWNFEEYIKSLFSNNNGKGNILEDVIKIICTKTGVSNSILSEASILAELNLSNKNYIEVLNEINKVFNLNMEYEDFINLVTVKDIVDNIPCNSIKEDGIKLEQIAYSLQQGRESMDERVVFVAESAEELLAAIRQSSSQKNVNGVYYGFGDKSTCDSELNSLISAWLEYKDVNWETLYKSATPKKAVLPEYPFAKERYWLPKEIIMNCKNEDSTGDSSLNQSPATRSVQLSDERGKLADIIASTLGISADILDYDTSFGTYGLDSYLGLKITQDITELYNCPMEVSILEEYNTVNKLYEYIAANNKKSEADSVVNENMENSELTWLLLKQLENGEIDVDEVMKIEKEVQEK